MLLSQALPSNMTWVIPVQPLKAQFPMLVTDAGMVMEDKLVQSLNASSPIICNCEFDAKVSVSKLLHAVKALSPIFVTEGPMVYSVT